MYQKLNNVEEQYLTCILKFHPEYEEEAKQYFRRLPQQQMFVGKLCSVESGGVVTNFKRKSSRITVLVDGKRWSRSVSMRTKISI